MNDNDEEEKIFVTDPNMDESDPELKPLYVNTCVGKDGG